MQNKLIWPVLIVAGIIAIAALLRTFKKDDTQEWQFRISVPQSEQK